MCHPQFTAPDLSAIARSLDVLEQSYDNDNSGGSTNMDDTGTRYLIFQQY
jgi:Ataxin-3